MGTLEVCVESASSAKEAVQAGASRIELCCDLFSGGLTPTRGLVIATLRKCPPQFPVHVLIRPRPGDFCYDEVTILFVTELFCSYSGNVIRMK